MTASDLIKQNIIGAIAGGLIAYFFPQVMHVSINIWAVPAGILSAISILLSVLLGALVGALVNIIVNKIRK